ncbi:hypothetical protein [Parafrankia discariae]|nr:hypothetical protein [Parafrankia discariae]
MEHQAFTLAAPGRDNNQTPVTGDGPARDTSPGRGRRSARR